MCGHSAGTVIQGEEEEIGSSMEGRFEGKIDPIEGEEESSGYRVRKGCRK